jgi:receptor expression-enhancing protein 1/2/3/4
MLGDFLCKILLNILGYVWPAYQCFKAVESQNTEHIREWAVYWLTLALFTGAERLLDIFVSWMPLYYEAKLLFVIWLWHPKSRGAVYLYTHTLQPLLLAHEATIDQKLEEFKAMGGDFVSGNFSKAMQFIQANAYGAVNQLQNLQSRTQGGGRHSSAGGNGRQSDAGGGYTWPSPRNAAQAAMNAFGTQRAGSGDGSGEARKQR